MTPVRAALLVVLTVLATLLCTLYATSHWPFGSDGLSRRRLARAAAVLLEADVAPASGAPAAPSQPLRTGGGSGGQGQPPATVRASPPRTAAPPAAAPTAVPPAHTHTQPGHVHPTTASGDVSIAVPIGSDAYYHLPSTRQVLRMTVLSTVQRMADAVRTHITATVQAQQLSAQSTSLPAVTRALVVYLPHLPDKPHFLREFKSFLLSVVVMRQYQPSHIKSDGTPLGRCSASCGACCLVSRVCSM